MNVIFTFVHPTNPSKVLGPFERLWFDAKGMSTDRPGSVLVPYRNHQWEVEKVSYFRLDCTAHVMLSFERGEKRSRTYGPFGRFSAVNGLAYADDGVVAVLDQKIGEWLYYDDGYHWPTMVVTKAVTKN